MAGHAGKNLIKILSCKKSCEMMMVRRRRDDNDIITMSRDALNYKDSSCCRVFKQRILKPLRGRLWW